MSDAVATMETPPTDKGPLLAVVRTRCGCERVVDIPNPPPQTLTIELAPLTKDEPKPDTRTFYLVGMGTYKQPPGGKRRCALYQEGPQPAKSLIEVPGMTPPRGLR
jgi:hypothetical protein